VVVSVGICELAGDVMQIVFTAVGKFEDEWFVTFGDHGAFDPWVFVAVGFASFVGLVKCVEAGSLSR
jgi:hypothetical protein